MKITIVKFKDGKYGIRKKSFINPTEFKDLNTPDYWWPLSFLQYSKDIKGTKEKVIEIYNNLMDEGKEVIFHGE